MDNNDINQMLQHLDATYIDFNIVYNEIYKYCIDIKTLVEINILTILNKTMWHLYNYNLFLTEKDIFNLYKINCAGIFTCDLFNEPSKVLYLNNDDNNDDNHANFNDNDDDNNNDDDYDDDDDYDIVYSYGKKNKKFMSFYINNKDLEYILNKLNTKFDVNNFSILLEDEIKNINSSEILKYKIDRYILNYNRKFKPMYLVSNMYDLINLNLSMLNPLIKTELDENYTFVVLIENQLETTTDIVELFTNAIFSV